MECNLYYPKNEELITLTYNKNWEKKIKYIEKRYSSFMSSHVVFCYPLDVNDKDIIRLYHDDEKIIDSIIQNAINENYVDLSDFYSHDELDVDY
jgi:hypothetical protein